MSPCEAIRNTTHPSKPLNLSVSLLVACSHWEQFPVSVPLRAQGKCRGIGKEGSLLLFLAFSSFSKHRASIDSRRPSLSSALASRDRSLFHQCAVSKVIR